MRVLHLTSGNLFGGVESFLLTLVRESGKAPGLESEFGVCFDGPLRDALEHQGAPVHRLGDVRLSRPGTVRAARQALRQVLRDGAFDAVVCHQPWTCVVFGSTVRESGFPVVLWCHMATDGTHWLERCARFVSPEMVVCNSRFTEAMVARWLPRARRHVALCPVSPPDALAPAERHQIRAALGVSDEDVVITLVARAESGKGHRVLLEACARLPHDRRWRCWVIGGAQRPPEVAYVESMVQHAQHIGVGRRVTFLGARSDARALMAASDIYCQPNLEPEGFGLTLVEALWAGLPVVASASGGALEIVDESCGVLTPAGDAGAVANVLARLLNDPERRARLQEAGPHRASALCGPDTQMSHIFRVLASMVPSGGTGQGARRAG